MMKPNQSSLLSWWWLIVWRERRNTEKQVVSSVRSFVALFYVQIPMQWEWITDTTYVFFGIFQRFPRTPYTRQIVSSCPSHKNRANSEIPFHFRHAWAALSNSHCLDFEDWSYPLVSVNKCFQSVELYQVFIYLCLPQDQRWASPQENT